LPDRDRSVFAALERMLATDPPDAAAFVAGIRPFLELRPDDSELRLLYARGLEAAGQLDEANTELARIIGRDPDVASAYLVQPSIAEASPDPAVRKRALDACIARLPRASACRVQSGYFTDMSCAAVEAAARQHIAVFPTHPAAYPQLTRALLDQGRPRPEISA